MFGQKFMQQAPDQAWFFGAGCFGGF